jgi:hypothetical protein
VATLIFHKFKRFFEFVLLATGAKLQQRSKLWFKMSKRVKSFLMADCTDVKPSLKTIVATISVIVTKDLSSS